MTSHPPHMGFEEARRILVAFGAEGVQYLLVGALAMAQPEEAAAARSGSRTAR